MDQKNGAIIGFWGITKKQGISVTLYNICQYIQKHIIDGKKILIIDLNFAHSNILKLFEINPDNELAFEDIMTFKTTGNNLNYNNLANISNLYFLSSNLPSISLNNRIMGVMDLFLKDIKLNFDIIFVDTVSGETSQITNFFLKKVDKVITILNQDIEYLKFTKKENELLYIVNKYSDIYPSIKEIHSISNIDTDLLYPLNFSLKLQEYKNRNKLKYFLSEEEDNYSSEIKNISEELIRILELPTKEERIEKKKPKLTLFGGQYT